jgi:pseudouridine synthase
VRAKLRTRVFPVGRLDFNSEGLILLTNDGDFAEAVQKRDDIPRVYTIKVKGSVAPEALRSLEKGARISPPGQPARAQMVRPHSVRKLRDLENKTQLQMVIRGGGAVDIRTLCEMKGLLVDKITRTAIGHLTLSGLMPGKMKLLKAEQVQRLFSEPELGLKMLEAEIEAEKPKGQRNFHEKKNATDSGATQPSGRIGTAFEAPAPKAEFKKKVVIRTSLKPRGPAPVAPLARPAPKRGVSRRGAAPRSASGGARSSEMRSDRGPSRGGSGRGGYGIYKPRGSK